MSDSPDSLIRIRWNAGGAVAAHYSPTAKRAKRLMTTFSPVLAERSPRSCSIVLPSYLSPLTCTWLSSTTSPEPLLDLALDDPRADVLGLVGGLLLEDAGLGVARLGRDLVLGDPARLRRGGDVQRDVLGEGDEVLVLGHEVGVAVDLDEHADLAVGVDVGLDGALGGLAVGELAELVAHLDPEDLGGLVDVAARPPRGRACSPSCRRRSAGAGP